MCSAFDASKLSTRQTNPDVDGNCLMVLPLPRVASLAAPPAERREMAKPAIGVGKPRPAGRGSSRPVAMPALAATCFPSSRQTGPSVGLSRRRGSRRSFAQTPRDFHPTARPLCSADCGLWSGVACAAGRPSNGQNLLRPPDSTTKQKETEGWRLSKPAGHRVQCGIGSGDWTELYYRS